MSPLHIVADAIDIASRIGWGVILTALIIGCLWLLIEAARARHVIEHAPCAPLYSDATRAAMQRHHSQGES